MVIHSFFWIIDTMVTSIGFRLSDGRLWVYSEFQQNKALIVLIDLKRHHVELYCACAFSVISHRLSLFIACFTADASVLIRQCKPKGEPSSVVSKHGSKDWGTEMKLSFHINKSVSFAFLCILPNLFSENGERWPHAANMPPCDVRGWNVLCREPPGLLNRLPCRHSWLWFSQNTTLLLFSIFGE